MVDEATELDVLEQVDRELIHSIFEWGDTAVREVMVPRTDMVTIESTAKAEKAMRILLDRALSRVPVRAKDADDIVGVLHLRDVARVLTAASKKGPKPPTAAELARPVLFVPDSKKADETLRQMQSASNHLAMVVDEYGGIAGLVTLEDLIEELVGDITDESDREAPDSVVVVGDRRWLVSARLQLDELSDLTDIEVEDEDVDSVGGLLTKHLDRLPMLGDRVEVDGLRLTAEHIEGRRKGLSRVLVERMASEDEDAEGEREGDGAHERSGVSKRVHDLRRQAQRGQVDADERAGRREDRDHLPEAADDQAGDPRHREPARRAAHRRRYAGHAPAPARCSASGSTTSSRTRCRTSTSSGSACLPRSRSARATASCTPGSTTRPARSGSRSSRRSTPCRRTGSATSCSR